MNLPNNPKISTEATRTHEELALAQGIVACALAQGIVACA